MRKFLLLAGCVLMIATMPAIAQTGPVATQCAKDIQAYCAGKGHGNRQTRSCLEANKDKVSAECRQALETTGGGRAMGKGKKQ